MPYWPQLPGKDYDRCRWLVDSFRIASQALIHLDIFVLDRVAQPIPPRVVIHFASNRQQHCTIMVGSQARPIVQGGDQVRLNRRTPDGIGDSMYIYVLEVPGHKMRLIGIGEVKYIYRAEIL